MEKRYLSFFMILVFTAQLSGSSLLKSALFNNKSTLSVKLKSKGSIQHKIIAGETIDSIASRYHITPKELKNINKSLKKGLTLGDTLVIPNQTIKLSDVLGDFRSAGPLLSEAKKHIGKTYVWGANGPKCFDCSGFTSYVCKQSGISIPRTSNKQGEVGFKLARGELKQGDLIFFDTSKENKGVINHVGIYIGNNKFIHASSATMSVVISSLEQPFYSQRFKWGSRVESKIARI